MTPNKTSQGVKLDNSAGEETAQCEVFVGKDDMFFRRCIMEGQTEKRKHILPVLGTHRVYSIAHCMLFANPEPVFLFSPLTMTLYSKMLEAYYPTAKTETDRTRIAG